LSGSSQKSSAPVASRWALLPFTATSSSGFADMTCTMAVPAGSWTTENELRSFLTMEALYRRRRSAALEIRQAHGSFRAACRAQRFPLVSPCRVSFSGSISASSRLGQGFSAASSFKALGAIGLPHDSMSAPPRAPTEVTQALPNSTTSWAKPARCPAVEPGARTAKRARPLGRSLLEEVLA
jgi:hypothetical protein